MVTEQVNSLRQEREAAVIGGLLLGGLTPNAQDVLATLDPEVFTIPLYKRAFEIIRAQARNRNLIDALIVGDEIGSENFIPLMQTARSCPSAANLKGYATLLQEEYQRRQMLELMEDIRYKLETGTLEVVRETMKYFDSRYSKLKTTKDKIIPVLLRDAVQEYTEVLSKRMECGVNSDNIKTGIEPLDEMLGGINATDLVLIAGRPGSGKSALALAIARAAAERPYPGGEGQRVGVLLFTLEMSLDQMTERAIAGAGNLSTDCLRNPVKLDDEGWAHVAQGMSALADLDVWIVDASQLTVEEIRATVERMKQDHPNLGMVMIDYIGLMKLAKAERHDLAVGQLSWSLKMMAKELRVPVAALAQLSRRVEERPNKRPNNSDLRDSGNLEQDADRIIMVYRDGYYNEQSIAREYMEIIVSKNRHGKTGTVYQRFDDNGNIIPCDQARAASACIQSMQQRPAASRFSPRNNQNNASF
ncbi:AAA family ATPase [Escherichia coli]|uniref:replicative DNA helicase n=1 Tax=Escherichia coli TaxID=562 RepID=UPI001BD49258|nr:replicative DNA helicase [Escherichia coli]EJH4232172.1 AAA family ATPase [Escherichia coli]EJH7227296.1 AAA family ATPase [Escherichia coli]EJL9683000.1 AAA family ATPase [Escherichia coli]MBS9628439.1 AAA family ATPase [Escherichia coli]